MKAREMWHRESHGKNKMRWKDKIGQGKTGIE